MNTQSVLFSFSGEVKKHLRRGTELGYPTANIEVDPETPEGIFVGFAQIDEVLYPSLIFVGKALTFDEHDKKAEIYILDFDTNIYGKEMKVICIQKIRDNMKFENKEALIAQMHDDERQAREYFNNQSSSRMRGSIL
ncbi:MAG: riboflavin kinase [Candidatus Roizmanbacteria bacterium]|nr:riboflavin kinase [Candidatus Roizmanbacteria bacterium]